MGRSRPHKVECRMNDKELEEYNKLVNKSKLKKQDYNLKCLLDKDIYVIDGIVELAYQIRKIGVNVNQIAHFANQKKDLSPTLLKEVDENIKEVWKLVNDFVKSVKK